MNGVYWLCGVGKSSKTRTLPVGRFAAGFGGGREDLSARNAPE